MNSGLRQLTLDQVASLTLPQLTVLPFDYSSRPRWGVAAAAVYQPVRRLAEFGSTTTAAYRPVQSQEANDA